MRTVRITGAGMTRFAKHPDRNLRSLSHEAVGATLAYAQIEQEMICAQTALAGGRILSRRSTCSRSRRSRRLVGPLSGRA